MSNELFIILLLIANSVYIFGLWNASKFEYLNPDNPEHGIIEGSKMILWKVRHYSLKYFGPFYSKPIITCPACMASIHSSYLFWPLVIHQYGFSHWLLLIYPLYVGVLSGLNFFISLLIELVEAMRDKYNYQ